MKVKGRTLIQGVWRFFDAGEFKSDRALLSTLFGGLDTAKAVTGLRNHGLFAVDFLVSVFWF